MLFFAEEDKRERRQRKANASDINAAFAGGKWLTQLLKALE